MSSNYNDINAMWYYCRKYINYKCIRIEIINYKFIKMLIHEPRDFKVQGQSTKNLNGLRTKNRIKCF